MVESGRNPYIIGTPIEIPDKLFGREGIFTYIEDSLEQNAQFILLHGQRRIGKSSVLKNIPLVISQDEFFFVHCDLQVYSHSDLGEIVYAIASEILKHLNLDRTILNTLINEDLDTIRKILKNRVLPPVYDILDKKKLVLLLDEFDVVTQDDTEQAFQLLRLLENLVKQQEELCVIAVIGRYLNSMPTLLQFFKEAPFREIGLLQENDAKQLITQLAGNNLQYQPKTITEILKFSSGHPFYTQVLCHEIFNLARAEGFSVVTPGFVTEVVNQAIESAEGGLGGFWDGLSISERVVISAVAEAQKQNTAKDPLQILTSYGLVLTDSLEQAIQLLIDKGFLERRPIKIKVELVRLWLVQRHQLRDEIRSLETLEEEKINQLLPVARNFWQDDVQRNALSLYENVLQLNPNYFLVVVELAENYLHVQNFDKALQLYERAYKIDAVRYQQELIHALNQYGHWLITQRNYTKAKQQYEKILQIEPESILAQQKIAEIKAFQNNKNDVSGNVLRQIRRLPISLIILLIIGGVGITFLLRQLSNSCPGGPEKSSSIFCVFSNLLNPEVNVNTPNKSISRGSRTLFPNKSKPNPTREQGIASFKKKDYRKAKKDFEEAVKNNRNDPEILIYQNNALALSQKVKPLTLAAAVSATNKTDFAQEVLRGIAQAQNQFNEEGGLNGRLLEIVIADDGNNKDQAKQVTQELVKDKSLMGVIGHNSSHVTEEVLKIYEQKKLALISATSSSILLKSPIFFRTLPSDEATGQKLAEYAASQLKVKKVVIFCNPKDEYSSSIREEFRTQYEKYDVKILRKPCVKLSNPKPGISKVKTLLYESKPRAIVLFPSTQHINDAIDIIKYYKKWINLQKINKPNMQELQLLGGDSLYSNQIIQEGGDDVEGLILAVPWFRDSTQESKTFGQKAEKIWRGPISWRTATSFDATQAFIESFKLSPPNIISQKTVLENLPKVTLSSDETSGEDLVFDKQSQEIKRKAILIRVEKRKFVLIPES